MNKNTLKLEFTKEDIYIHLGLSDNFNAHNPLFDELAFYLGGLEYHQQKDSASIHFTTLEKLEILCKKAREYADEESNYSARYNEVKVLVANDKYKLEGSLENATTYDKLELLSNNLLKVKLDNKFGVLDLLGKEILPIKFDEIFMLADNLVQASENAIINLYDIKGNKEITGLEDVVENNPFDFHQSYFWLKKDKKWGLFDNKLNVVLPLKLEYDSCELISDNIKENIYIKVQKDGKCGLIDGLLNIVVIELDEDIQDISFDHKKNFLVKKFSSPDTISIRARH